MIRQREADMARGRIVAFLTRDEIDFIDKLSKDALFSTGHKLSRTDIIRAFVDAVKVKDIDADGIDSKSGLEKKLLAIMGSVMPQVHSALKKGEERDDKR